MFEALCKLLTGWFGPPTQSQAHSPEPENAEISRSTVKIDEIHSEITESIDSHPVPYDETLLERVRTQWQFGDWQSLAQLNRDTLQHHPDRAKLALLAAAGLLQIGNNNEAKKFIRFAQDWGISKKLISQILIAGVHNSIGRAAAICDQRHALKHFETAIAIGTPGVELRLLAQSRRNEQINQLVSLFPECYPKVDLLKKTLETAKFSSGNKKWAIETQLHIPALDKIGLKDILEIDGISFSDFEQQPYGTVVGFSEKFVLKVEIYPHKNKRNNLRREADIIRYLNSHHCPCVVNFHSQGWIGEKPYLIVEKIAGKKECKPVDVLFSFCAMAGLGVIHADLAPWEHRYNHLHDGLVAIVFDFDQAVIDDGVRSLTFSEMLGYLERHYPFLPGKKITDQLRHWSFGDYVKDGRLDISKTTLMMSGVSTNSPEHNNIYHDIRGKKIICTGERGIEERALILEKIDFSGEYVLDIGANTGELTRHIAKTAAHVDGIERCHEHAIVGQLVNCCESVTNARIHHLDACDEWPRESYDTVILFSVLHHISNPDALLSRIKSSAKRVVIECKPNEKGSTFVGGSWVETQKWNFSSLEEMVESLSDAFGMKFCRNLGDSGRERCILEFSRSQLVNSN